VLSAGGDAAAAEAIFYSDYVTKFNRHNAPQERVLLVTSAAFYNLERRAANKLRQSTFFGGFRPAVARTVCPCRGRGRQSVLTGRLWPVHFVSSLVNIF
jgi:hypothetical protein